MKKLRLLVTEYCPKNCAGCCNKDIDLDALPIISSVDQLVDYDEIYVTGGEPLCEARTDHTLSIIASIIVNTKARIFVYTSAVDNPVVLAKVLTMLHGMTITLHTQKDAEDFKIVMALMSRGLRMSKSLRLNVFKGVDITGMYTGGFMVKDNIEWIKDCLLPVGEEFKRIGDIG